MALKIIKAELDLRGKTKLLRVEGEVLVNSPLDEIKVASPVVGLNSKIAICHIEIIDNGGPKKPQPMLFQEQFLTVGDEDWTQIQISIGSENDTMEITVLSWASNRSGSRQPDLVGGDSGSSN